MPDLASIPAFATLRSIGEGDGVIAHERKGLGIATVMTRKGEAAALSAVVKKHLDITLPTGPRCADNDAMTWLGTGPGRWLVVHNSPTAGFAGRLTQQLEGIGSVVDQSGAYGVLRLSGPALLETLAKGIAVDLACAPGSVIVTQIAHVGATLWKIDDTPAFGIAVARSLAGSFLHWLEASAAARGLRAV